MLTGCSELIAGKKKKKQFRVELFKMDAWDFSHPAASCRLHFFGWLHEIKTALCSCVFQLMTWRTACSLSVLFSLTQQIQFYCLVTLLLLLLLLCSLSPWSGWHYRPPTPTSAGWLKGGSDSRRSSPGINHAASRWTLSDPPSAELSLHFIIHCCKQALTHIQLCFSSQALFLLCVLYKPDRCNKYWSLIARCSYHRKAQLAYWDHYGFTCFHLQHQCFGFLQMSELTGGEVNGEVAGFKGRRLLLIDKHVVLSSTLWWCCEEALGSISV